MFSLHICHKCTELLSLIESDSLLTLIYVLLDNVSCYEYPAGIEHWVRVRSAANYFCSLCHPGSCSVAVPGSEELLCFPSSGAEQSGGTEGLQALSQPWEQLQGLCAAAGPALADLGC